MRNDAQKVQGGVPRSGRSSGFFPSSLRAISSYLRIGLSGASSVASTVRSAGASVASAISDREGDAVRDKVHWAGFDRLECEGNIVRCVLLLGYRTGFQVWDVEEANDVRELASKQDGPVAFLQMLLKPLPSLEDMFADVRPLLVVVDGPSYGGRIIQDGVVSSRNGSTTSCHELGNGNFVPTVVQFYSLRSHSYVRALKFRSVVYSVRCSARVVAISQAAQIHCFDAATLERVYNIVTYPIISGCHGHGGIGYGPLAVGSRWLAYTGSPVVISTTGRVSPQHLSPTNISSSQANGSLVAHYAKESSKQLATGIVALGDMGYQKLSKYCSELLPDNNISPRQGNPLWKTNGSSNGYLPDAEHVGMVIIRDIVSKSIVAQFRAQRSPISALCFDPSGTLLVTASIQGHNINVFRIMPSQMQSSPGCDPAASYVHLYKLQRGFTNAVIQDISFSDDSHWIMISSSRGTSHLFAISPFGGTMNFNSSEAIFNNGSNGLCLTAKPAVRWPPSSGQLKPYKQNLYPSGPVTLSVVSRIKNGNNGWRGTVGSAAAAATGRESSLSGAITSVFHYCKGNSYYPDNDFLKSKYHLLVFSPSGSVVQYVLRLSNRADSLADVPGLNGSYDSVQDKDVRLVVEKLQKWDICQKHSRTEQEDNVDIYGEHGNSENSKLFLRSYKKGTSIYPADGGTLTKEKPGAEERPHLYISNAELQMHQPRVPLWAKSEIYFQVMTTDGIQMEKENVSGGEIEIERIPTRTVEARSKDLIPLFGYLQSPSFQQARAPNSDGNSNGLLHQQSSCSSTDCLSEGAATMAESQSGSQSGEKNIWGSLQEGFVNNSECPKMEDQLESVNSRESPRMDTRLEFVNNRESTKVETHFKDEENDST